MNGVVTFECSIKNRISIAMRPHSYRIKKKEIKVSEYDVTRKDHSHITLLRNSEIMFCQQSFSVDM